MKYYRDKHPDGVVNGWKLKGAHGEDRVLVFIIHPCDPTVVFCYLIWLCDIGTVIQGPGFESRWGCMFFTLVVLSHSSSLSCNTVIKRYFRFGV